MSKQKEEFEEWLKDRPRVIQDLGKKYPIYELYRMKENAPYAISCAGTIVYLYSYIESGNVTVVVMAKDKLPSAIKHEKKLLEKFKHLHTAEEIEKWHNRNISVEIDPVWLEIIPQEIN